MGVQPRILVPVAVVVVALAGVATYLAGPLMGVGVLVVLGLLVAVLAQRYGPGADSRDTEGDLLEGYAPDDAVAPIGDRAVEPLAPWSPPEDLQPWSPPTAPEAVPGDAWAGDTGTWTEDTGTWTEDTGTWDGDNWDGGTWDGDTALRPLPTEPAEPISDLGSLHDVDVVAEVEALDGAFVEVEPVDHDADAITFAPGPIDEKVETADDILQASRATELQVVEPAVEDNSELARLLAKVQARLAAYE